MLLRGGRMDWVFAASACPPPRSPAATSRGRRGGPRALAGCRAAWRAGVGGGVSVRDRVPGRRGGRFGAVRARPRLARRGLARRRVRRHGPGFRHARRFGGGGGGPLRGRLEER